MPEIGDADITIHADGSAARRELRSLGDEGGRSLSGLRGRLAGLGSDLAGIERLIGNVGKSLAIASAGPGLLVLAGAAIQASGALLALPDALATAGAATAAFKMGTSGLGDVFDAVSKGSAKDLAAAMQNIAPAAKPAVQEMVNFQNGLKGVQQVVQSKMFEGLAGPIQALASTYLPMLKTGLGAIGTSFNTLFRDSMAAAQTPFFKGAVNTVLESTARVVAGLSPLVTGLMTAFAAMSAAAAPFIEKFIAFIGTQAQAAGAFLSSAEGAAWLNEKLTAAGEGFNTLFTILSQLAPILSTLFTVLTTLATAFNGLPAPVQTVLSQFIIWGSIVGLVVTKLAPLLASIIALGPALMTAGTAILAFGARLVGVLVSMTLFIGRMILMAATAVAQFAVMIANVIIWGVTMVAQFTLVIAKAILWGLTMAAQFALVAARAIAWAAIMAAQWLIAMGPIGWIIAAVIALVALIIANWDTIKAATIAAWTAVVSFLTGLWNSIKSMAAGAFNAVVAAISGAWNSAVAFTTSTWNSIVSFVVGAWNGLTSAVSTGVSTVIGFIASLPGKALAALSSLGTLLVGLGRDMVNGLWNGIQAGWSWLTGQVASLARRLLDAAKSALGISSPSKEFADEVGEPSGEGIGSGLTNSASGIMSSIRSLTGQMVKEAAKIPGELPPITAQLGLGSTSMSVGKTATDFASAVRQGAYEGVLAGMRERPAGSSITIQGGGKSVTLTSEQVAQRLRSLSELGVV